MKITGQGEAFAQQTSFQGSKDPLSNPENEAASLLTWKVWARETDNGPPSTVRRLFPSVHSREERKQREFFTSSIDLRARFGRCHKNASRGQNTKRPRETIQIRYNTVYHINIVCDIFISSTRSMILGQNRRSGNSAIFINDNVTLLLK